MTRSHKIGWLVLAVALLFALWRMPRLHGQGFGSFSHDQPYLAADRAASSGGCPIATTDPSGSSTLYADWRSTDFPMGETNGYATGANTNYWTDRIGCVVSYAGRLVSSSAQVTNSSSGMYFANGGGSSSCLTNSVLAAGTNQTVSIVFSPTDVTDATYPMPVFTPYDFTDGTQGSTPGGIGLDKTGYWTWGTMFAGGTRLSDVARTGLQDIILVQSNTIAFFYTNGVLSVSFTRTPPVGGWPWRYIGGDNVSVAPGLKGYIREIQVWSTNLSSAQVALVHTANTNTYSFTP